MAHKMKHFTKMLKTLLTLFTEHFILVIWRGFEYHSIIVSQCKENTSEISRVFPTEGCGESPPPYTSQNFAHPPPGKIPPHCLCTIFVLIGYFLDPQVMLILVLTDVQYSQKAFFIFEKRFDWSKSLLLRFSLLSKKSPSCLGESPSLLTGI